MEVTADLKELYPFQGKYFDNKSHRYHYLDEGPKDAPVIVMVHGNPTWSFYYRNLVKALSSKYRVIVPDHFGCGLSDHIDPTEYTLSQRIVDLTALLESLNLQKYSMIVHDWGGAIGFGHAVDHVDKIDKMVILNTAAFKSESIPKSIQLCKNSFFGDFLVRHLNGFCFPATFMTTVRKLSPLEKKGYLFPYQGASKRYAISEFVKDIPLNEKHQSYGKLDEIESKLSLLQGKKLILWGGKDFCFHDEFYNQFRTIYPDAQYKYYKNAGHYVLEDETEDTLIQIQSFLES